MYFIFENKIEIRYSLLRSWKCARVSGGNIRECGRECGRMKNTQGNMPVLLLG